MSSLVFLDAAEQHQGGPVDDSIEDTVALTPRLHNTVGAQQAELVACRGLALTRGLNDFRYGLLTVVEKIDYSQPHGVSERAESWRHFFEQFHIDKLVFFGPFLHDHNGITMSRCC